MYITTPKRKNGITVVRLVQGVREGNKVKSRIVKTIGQSKDPQEIEQLKEMALHFKKMTLGLSKMEQRRGFPNNIPFKYLQGDEMVNNGVFDILGFLYEALGFSRLISSGRKGEFWNEVLKHCVFSRFLEPASKLRSVELIQDRFHKSFSYDQVLRMMDILSKDEEKIKAEFLESVRKKSQSLELLLFDVTTLYFENVTLTDLKQFGYSKDGKFNEVQIVLALLTDGDGLPLTYELFPGNTAETKTLVHCLDKLRSHWLFKKVCLTADRAMYSERNLSYFEKRSGYEYIVACPLRRLPKRLKEKVLDKRNYKVIDEDRGLYKFVYKDRFFYVGYSKKRAGHDRLKREVLLEKIRRVTNKKGEVSVDKLSSKKGMARYLEKAKGYVRIREDRIIEDEKWEGIFGVCSNRKSLTGEKVFSSYKRLWKIEESFRINKHTLKMRPIYHQKSRRIRAHILICFLTYALLRYAEVKLKTMGLSYGPKHFIDILSRVESWIFKDIKSGNKYLVPRRMSETACQIYKAFAVKRNYSPYQILSTKKETHLP